MRLIAAFSDPWSFLVSQRVDRCQEFARQVSWCMVTVDPHRPLGGIPLDEGTATAVRAQAFAGEMVPEPGIRRPNGGPATAAYAEAEIDGLAAPMRRALFEAIWRDHLTVDDPNVLRLLVARVYAAHPEVFDPHPRSVLGDWSVRLAARRQGLVVSMAGGPLSDEAHRKVRRWQLEWDSLGRPELPVLLAKDGMLTGASVLEFLVELCAPAFVTSETENPGRGGETSGVDSEASESARESALVSA
ncbi:MAG: hypothetical protein IRZ02_04475 [Acidothermus sp.]|nr:hypothetical protein [Acidothermus sp.]